MQGRYRDGVLGGFELAVDAKFRDSLVKLLVEIVRKISFTSDTTKVIFGRLFYFFFREQNVRVDLLNWVL